MAMQKKLVRHGNSLAVVIDRSVLRLLGMDEKTTFSIETDGKRLVLTPHEAEKHKAEVDQARRRVFRRHDKLFRALAD